LLEVPERAAQEPEWELERTLRAPAQVLLEQEPARVPELLRQALPEQEPEPVQTSPEIS
jgi:hypothetical protein